MDGVSISISTSLLVLVTDFVVLKASGGSRSIGQRLYGPDWDDSSTTRFDMQGVCSCQREPLLKKSR
jgi:hypothetical protein